MIARIIPRLDVKGSSLVKGINLEGLRVLGEPSVYARHYYENGADELIYQDVVASLHKKNTLLDLIERTAKEIFVPLTVGGGIKTVEDIKKILNSGADKVSLNSAVINEPGLINEFVNIFGSSTIVITIEAMEINNEYFAFTDNGRVNSGKKIVDWVEEIQSRGAGEIILTSIKHEGAGKDFNHELYNSLKQKINIPFLIHGGAGLNSHIENAIRHGVDGVVISSLLHYNFLFSEKNTSKVKEGNIEFLNSRMKMDKFEKTSLSDIKKYLINQNINIRI